MKDFGVHNWLLSYAPLQILAILVASLKQHFCKFSLNTVEQLQIFCMQMVNDKKQKPFWSFWFFIKVTIQGINKALDCPNWS